MDVLNYEPPGTDDLDAAINRGGDMPNPPPPVSKPPPANPPVKVATPAKKPEVKPLDGKKPDPAKPDQRKPEELPINELRTAYQTAKADLEKTRQEMESLRADHPELKSTRAELEEVRKQRDDFEKARVDYERKLAFYNPKSHTRIAKMDAEFNKEMTPQIQDIPGLAREYGSLVRQYAQLPRGAGKDEEFKAALDDLEQGIIDRYGDRKADRIMGMLQRGNRHLQEVSAVEKELQQDGGKFMFETVLGEWSEGAKKFEEDAKDFLAVTEEVAETDPYHPMFFLQHCAKEDKEHFDALKTKLMAFSRRVSLGPRPRQKSDFEGMDDQQISAKLVEEAKQASQDKRLGAKMIVQAGLLMSFWRPFYAHYQKMVERLGDDAFKDPDPGRPTKDVSPAGKGPTGAGDSVDAGEYEPPAIPDESTFARG